MEDCSKNLPKVVLFMQSLFSALFNWICLFFVVVIVALLVFLSLKSEVHPELLVDGTLKSKN